MICAAEVAISYIYRHAFLNVNDRMSISLYRKIESNKVDEPSLSVASLNMIEKQEELYVYRST